MLRGIPKIISPELLKILMEMGHGDELCIGDGNFPAASNAQILVRADGHGVPELLEAILSLFPLDTFEAPVHIMDKVVNDGEPIPIWKTYEELVRSHTDFSIIRLERFAFYDRAKKCYAILATSEPAPYANIILKKGVIKD